MNMYDPPHPGEIVREFYLEAAGRNIHQLAECLDMSIAEVENFLNGGQAVTAKLALRISSTLGGSPQSWMSMQNERDLWLAKQSSENDTAP